jgi:DNA-binding NtrC family response regulator
MVDDSVRYGPDGNMSRILIVDDEADVLRMLSALFRSQGHNVVVTDDGNEAVDLLRGKETFDLMISDVRMIPINGIWLLSLVREECPTMPVIMVTAYYSKEMAVEALRMGALDYIAKPFDTQKLLDLVNKTLKSQAKSAAKAAPAP